MDNTPESIPVFSGKEFFRIIDTKGFPAELAFLECKSRGWYINWNEFIQEAIKAGWSDKTILLKFKEMGWNET